MGFADNVKEEWFPQRDAPTQEQIDTVSFHNTWTPRHWSHPTIYNS